MTPAIANIDKSAETAPAGAWLGPAIGASLLTLAWAAYLMPVFFGIVALG